MISPELKSLVKKYLKLTFWYSCNQENQTLSVEQFEVVLKEIGNLENQLVANGLKDEQTDWLIKFTSDIANKPFNELPEHQQLMMIRAIFGVGMRL